MTDSERQAYRKGFIDGLTAFSWWKNGVEFVGTCGKTLNEVVSMVEETWNFDRRYDLKRDGDAC